MPNRHPAGANGTQWCSRCKQFLPPESFWKDPTRWNGLQIYCRTCAKDMHANWRRQVGIKTREEHLAQIRKPGFCSDCKQFKPLWCFGKNDARPNKIQHVCRQCFQKRNIRRWWIHIKADPKKHAAEKKKSREYMRTYRQAIKKRPEIVRKKAAAAMIGAAIAGGYMTKQPCEVCGNPKVEAHHDDYSKPLEVKWLCRVHHREHHALYPKVHTEQPSS